MYHWAMCCIYTSMIVSAFHNRWNRTVARQHPSLWVFLTKLKDEQRRVERECAHAERGDRAPAPRRKWRQLQIRLDRMRTQLERGFRNLDQYWVGVKFAIRSFEQ